MAPVERSAQLQIKGVGVLLATAETRDGAAQRALHGLQIERLVNKAVVGISVAVCVGHIPDDQGAVWTNVFIELESEEILRAILRCGRNDGGVVAAGRRATDHGAVVEIVRIVVGITIANRV